MEEKTKSEKVIDLTDEGDLGERAEPISENSKTEEEKDRAQGRILARLIEWVLFALLGYLCPSAVLPFGAAPFGAALLCAADIRAIPIFLGLCASSISSENPLLLIGIWSATLCVRLLAVLLIDNSRAKQSAEAGSFSYVFKERTSLKLASAALCAFSVSLLRVLASGFLYYDIFGLIISTAAAPIAALFLSGAFSEGKLVEKALEKGEIYPRRAKKQDMWKAVGWASLCLLTTFTLKSNSVYGISLAAFCAMCSTLFFSRTKGMIFGGVVGLLCGLVYSPICAPIFVFSAFASGVFFPMSVTLALWSSFAIGVGWGFYVKGISALSGLFPALLASALLFGVADRLFIAPRIKEKLGTKEEVKEESKNLPRVVLLPDSALDRVRLDNTKQKIKSLCETLTSLSESFSGSGEGRFRSPAAEYFDICEGAFESTCASCENREECRKKVATSKESQGLSRVLLKNRAVCISDVGRTLSGFCHRLPDIIDEINHNASLAMRRSFESDRSEIFALDYAAIANLLAEAQVEEAEEIKVDAELGDRLCAAIGKLELECMPKGAAVFGKRRRRITIQGSYESIAANFTALLDCAEEALSFKLDRKGARIHEGSVCELLAEEAETLTVSFAQKVSLAEGEREVCGDSVRSFFDSDGHFYTCISDGMGSGRHAAAVSEISADFLERMLSADSPVSCRSPKAALEMLNCFLQSKNYGSESECSATIDLLELDTVRKQAYFCKCGAAPTYIFRKGNLYKLRSGTMPIGILDSVDCRVIKFDVDEGDLVVMISDGVVQGKEECPWLYDLLSHTAESDRLETIAERIVKNAKTHGSRDDISVCVIRV